jgi:NADH:ubiquinone oxidoreductase subunit F (NADH-binding)
MCRAEPDLFGRPTLEQNVETLFWVRDIVERGVDWFTSQGRHERKGFRSFSVSGRVTASSSRPPALPCAN